MRTYICETTKKFENSGREWKSTFDSITLRGCTSLWIIKHRVRYTAEQQYRGAAPITPAKGYSPFANPGLVWGRDFVPRTLAKGPAPLRSPVFFLLEGTGNKEIVMLTKSIGKIV